MADIATLVGGLVSLILGLRASHGADHRLARLGALAEAQAGRPGTTGDRLLRWSPGKRMG